MSNRYQRSADLLALILELQAAPDGMTFQEIADVFGVSRRTAERMLTAVRRHFPEIEGEAGEDGRKYWRLTPTPRARRLSRIQADELAALEGAAARARSPADADALRTLALKVRAFAEEPSPDPAPASGALQPYQGAVQLAGSVAHSIRNPLATLIGTAELALETPEDARAALTRIAGIGRRIRDTVEGTLNLLRGRGLVLRPESPAAILGAVRDEVLPEARKSGVRIELDVSRDLPPFGADRVLLTHALANLAHNSIEAMPNGGRLWLEARLLDQGASVRFTVADSGSGIPEEILARVTEPLFTTKPEGTGLGLTIAQAIARAHRGTLRFETPLGGGTAVTLDIPVEGRDVAA